MALVLPVLMRVSIALHVSGYFFDNSMSITGYRVLVSHPVPQVHLSPETCWCLPTFPEPSDRRTVEKSGRLAYAYGSVNNNQPYETLMNLEAYALCIKYRSTATFRFTLI